MIFFQLILKILLIIKKVYLYVLDICICVKTCSYLLKSTLVLRDPTLKWLYVFLNTARDLTLEKII